MRIDASFTGPLHDYQFEDDLYPVVSWLKAVGPIKIEVLDDELARLKCT